MEWQAPAIVLDARAHGEGGAVATLLTEEHGRHAGLVRGGFSRAQAGTWQPGNLVEADIRSRATGRRRSGCGRGAASPGRAG